MDHKLIYIAGIIILFTGVFTVFGTVVNAENLSFLCSNKQKLSVILKNEAEIDKSKKIISEIPYVKIINTKYRDKEWSKMVNKYDLPNMENPFKNEFIVKVNKKADANEILSKIKELSFVEKAEFVSDTKGRGK